MLPYLSGWTTPRHALSVRVDDPPGPAAIYSLGRNPPTAGPASAADTRWLSRTRLRRAAPLARQLHPGTR